MAAAAQRAAYRPRACAKNKGNDMSAREWIQKRDGIIRRLAGEGMTTEEIAGRMRLLPSLVRSVLYPAPETRKSAAPAVTSPYFDKNARLTEFGKSELLRRFDDGDDLVSLAHDFGYANERGVRSAVYFFRAKLAAETGVVAEVQDDDLPARMFRPWPVDMVFEDDPRALRKVVGAMPVRPLPSTMGGVARYG
ncbi:MAG: hypothetical protein HQL44_17030 [Alphaproteobacteria bacterium]|nr:hypothetical protein [Alphaproteobacteria bacterium]